MTYDFWTLAALTVAGLMVLAIFFNWLFRPVHKNNATPPAPSPDRSQSGKNGALAVAATEAVSKKRPPVVDPTEIRTKQELLFVRVSEGANPQYTRIKGRAEKACTNDNNFSHPVPLGMLWKDLTDSSRAKARAQNLDFTPPPADVDEIEAALAASKT